MATWDLPIDLDRSREATLYLQIASAIQEGIRKGRLRPGDALPGTRALAEQLGVNRNTTLAAYRELAAEGWVETEPDSGTYVSDHPPVDLGAGSTIAAADSGSWTSPSPALDEPFFQPPAVERDGFQLLPDLPDVRLAPTAAIHRAYGRALRLQQQRALQPGWDPRGHLHLRASLCQLLRELRGLAFEPGNLVLTRGIMDTLHLCSLGLFAPGDAVVVENPGPFRLAESFRHAGARLMSVGVDAEGLDVEALAALMDREPVKLVCVTANAQVPTHARLSAPRRQRLLELARTTGASILEADLSLGFHPEGRPSLALAAEDEEGRVFYLATLEQMLAPGLQVGFLAGPAPDIKAMAKRHQLIEWPGNLLQEASLEELFRDGEIHRHLRRMRKVADERRAALVDRIQLHLGAFADVEDPREGLSLWVSIRQPGRIDAWVDRCAAKGVVFYPGRIYEFLRDPLPFVALGFAAHTVEELNEACGRMAQAWREVQG
jgi:GntR family transcriptional regulator/MocR family aminotransferase